MATLVARIRANWADLPGWMQHALVASGTAVLAAFEQLMEQGIYDWHTGRKALVKAAGAGLLANLLHRMAPPAAAKAPADPPAAQR